MTGIVGSYLAGMRVGEGREFSGMTLFPVFREGRSPLRYRVLSECLADGSVEVTERPSATVPMLWLVNRSDEMVLVMDGEEIVGGKQNRMVNASFLIAAKSEVELPVTCVEHGRWHDVSANFLAGEAAPAFLRRAKDEQVKANLRTAQRPMADQGAVWDAIALKHRAEGTHSRTGALHDIYEQKAKSLAGYERAFPVEQGAVGFAVALDGGMVGADLFDQPEAAAKLWAKVVRSYAMDARGIEDKLVARDRAEKLLKRIVDARVETFPSIGVGQDLRLEGDGANATALVFEGIVVHLGVFRIHGKRAGVDYTGMARASMRRRMQRSGGGSVY